MPGPLIAGVVGSVASAGIAANSASTAAKAQGKAANQQIAESRRQFDVIQNLMRPYVEAGTTGLQAQLDLMGIGGRTATGPAITTVPGQGGAPAKYTVNGQTFNTMAEAQAYSDANKTGGISAQDAQRAAIDGLANGEQFQALTDQGEYALLASKSATGGLRGGDTAAAMAQFRPAMLQGLIDRQLAQYGGLAANGQSAAAQTGVAAQQTGQQVNQALGDRGAARAGAALAQGQAYQNAGAGILQTLGGLAQPLQPGGGAFQRWTF
jgi:hypothetical protein